MFTKTFFLLLLCASWACANPRVDVPVVLSPGGRPLLGVSMGTKGVGEIQNFNFTLTTSIGYTSVANDLCANCSSNIARYNMSLSPDAQNLNQNAAMGFVTGGFSGPVIKENCTLQNPTSPWLYTNQTIIRMTDVSTENTPFNDGISGLVGLGTLKTPTNSAGFPANFNDSIFGQFFIRNPDAQNFTFGFALKPSPVIPGNSTTQLTFASGVQSVANQDAGVVNWLHADSAQYNTNQVVVVNVANVSGGYLPYNQQPDWTVHMDGWSAKIGTTNIGNGNGIYVNVDPYFSGIYLPGNQATLIHDAIPGSTKVAKSTIGQTTSWEVPCNTSIQFIVSINGQQFLVDQSILVQPAGDGTCISIIEGFFDSSVTQYIFGQTWLSSLYVIYNVPQNGNASISFAFRSSPSSGTNVGAIVGGVVGGVAGVIALGLLGFYFIRRRHDKSFFKRTVELEEERQVATTVEPYTFGHHPALPGTAYRGPGSPELSPHAPLLDRDAGPLPHFPPSYEEASEGGGSSSAGGQQRPSGRPTEKGGNRETMMSGVSSAPVSPDPQHTTF